VAEFEQNILRANVPAQPNIFAITEDAGGGRFAQQSAVSRWVGVKPSPEASDLKFDCDVDPPGRNLRAICIIVTPRDERGKMLSPFHTQLLRFKTTADFFPGATQMSYDGRYSRTLAYRKQDVPNKDTCDSLARWESGFCGVSPLSCLLRSRRVAATRSLLCSATATHD